MDVLHGKQLNGTGFIPALPAGLNEATIKLKGKTIANNDTVEVTGEFTVAVRAKVSGLQVFRNGVALAYSGVVTGPGMKTFAAPVSGTYTVVNTGNVPLSPEVFHYISEGTTTKKIGTAFELLPGQTRDITDFMDPNGYGTHIEFFDTGAVLVTPISTRIVDTLEALIFMQRPL